MLQDNPVRLYRSGDAGLTLMTGTAGSLVKILNSCMAAPSSAAYLHSDTAVSGVGYFNKRVDLTGTVSAQVDAGGTELVR